jgi:hypothetical protein
MSNIQDYHRHCNRIRRKRTAIINEITRKVIVAETLALASEITKSALSISVKNGE